MCSIFESIKNPYPVAFRRGELKFSDQLLRDLMLDYTDGYAQSTIEERLNKVCDPPHAHIIRKSYGYLFLANGKSMMTKRSSIPTKYPGYPSPEELRGREHWNHDAEIFPSGLAMDQELAACFIRSITEGQVFTNKCYC